MYLLLYGVKGSRFKPFAFNRVHSTGFFRKAFVSAALIVNIQALGCYPRHCSATICATEKTAEQVKLFLFWGVNSPLTFSKVSRSIIASMGLLSLIQFDFALYILIFPLHILILPIHFDFPHGKIKMFGSM